MTEQETELLLKAGAAAGFDVGVIHQRPHRRCDAGWTPWNPLDDDGDALRLAVRLRMNINIYASGAEADCDTLESTCKESGDHSAATRRAIVRAAAAVGATSRA